MTAYLVLLFLLIFIAKLLLWPARSNISLCLCILSFFCVVGFVLYDYVGAPELLPLIEKHNEKMLEARTTIQTESGKIQKDSKNLEAWIRLGQAFAISEQWRAAANAFKQSVLLSGGQPDLIMAYARAMIMEEEGKVSDLSKKSLEMVLMQKPSHAEAKYYLAVRRLQDGDTAGAMQSMKSLYASLPAGSPLKSMIDQQIGRH